MTGFLFIASMILLLVGSVMLLIEAFGAGMLWGLGCLFLPLPVALLFIGTHWHSAKKAFLVQVAGLVLFFMAGRGAV
jgi:hypothetical protein